MKKVISLVLLAGVLGASGYDNGNRIGAGGVIGGSGGVTGLGGKYWINRSSAVQGLLSFENDGVDTNMVLQADYLLHDKQSYKIESGDLSFYYGGGVELGTNDYVGVRFPVGLSYDIENTPFDVYAEIAPELGSKDSNTVFGFGGAFGFRYYVK